MFENVDTLVGDMDNLRTTNGQGKRKVDAFEDLFPTPASRLGFLVKDKGVTQRDIAQLLGVSAPYISTVVSGQKGMEPGNWLKVAEYFGVTVDWLLCRKGAPMYWPADAGDVPVGVSKAAEEAARILDSMPPRKRDEMLGVLRAMSFSVQLADLDADETTRRLRDSLAAAGLVLSPKVIEAIRSTLFAFAMGLGPDRSGE